MQADILRDLGCSFGQGWLFGRAVPPPDAALLLRRRFGQPASGDRLSTVSPFQRLHQLEALYRNAPVALCFIDRAQRCVSANHRFQQVVGLTSSRLMGRRLFDVVSVASMGGLLAAVERISQGAAPAQVQIEAPCDAWYLASVQPVTDEVGEWIGTSIIMLNVTDQRRAERAIRESEEHFRRANELCPDIAWTALPDALSIIWGRRSARPATCRLKTVSLRGSRACTRRIACGYERSGWPGYQAASVRDQLPHQMVRWLVALGQQPGTAAPRPRRQDRSLVRSDGGYYGAKGARAANLRP